MIIYGTKIKRKKMGYAADYCPSCRTPLAMPVVRVSKAGHLYYVSLSDGKPQHYESTCPDCGAVLARNLSEFSCFVQQPDLELALSRGTTPGYERWLEEREQSEERVLTDAATPEERLDHIRQVLASLSYMAKSKAVKSSDESVTAVIALLFILAVFAAAFAASGNMPAQYGPPSNLAAALMLAVLIYRVVVTTRKTQARLVQPQLVKGLAPLDPSREELETVLNEMRKSSLAKGLDPGKLLAAINEEQQREEHA